MILRSYDFNIGDAHEIVIQGSDSEKLKVCLASKLLDRLESKYKVKLDDRKNRIDISVKNREVSKTQTRDARCIIISIPQKFLAGLEISAAASILKIRDVEMESLEFGGKVNSIQISNFHGHLELDCSCNMKITCGDLHGRIDVNQISAVSIIHIPSETGYLARTRDHSNQLLFTRDRKLIKPVINEETDNRIELSGMNSELTIDEYTVWPLKTKEGAL